MGTVVRVMFNKMHGYSFYYRHFLWIWAGIPKTQSFDLCLFLTQNVRNGPSVSFETNVPCINNLQFTIYNLQFTIYKLV